MKAIFEGSCPNCGGAISDDRLLLKAPCRNCLPAPEDELSRLSAELPLPEYRRRLASMLKERGNLQKFEELILEDERLQRFSRLFERCTGHKPWSAQKLWARRILKGESFAIIAPTGTGKTLLGCFTALYLAAEGKRSYLIFPTTLLVEQALGRLQTMMEKSGIKARLLAYSSAYPPKERKLLLESIEEGNFHALLTTSRFLSSNFGALKGKRFDFVFVDDVDALLKRSRNIDRVLALLGFDREDVESAYRLVKLKVGLAAGRGARPEELEPLARAVAQAKNKRNVGALVLSTATGRPRGLRVKLFRELLGLEVGSVGEGLRNVQDAYLSPKRGLIQEVCALASTLGDGGLVFVPPDRGAGEAEEITSALNREGLKAAFVTSQAKERVEEFAEGRLNLLVGMASYYGLLVRGIDLPQRIRYAIFAGVPKFKFDVEAGLYHPTKLIQTLIELQPLLGGAAAEKAAKLAAKLRRYVRLLPLAAVKEAVKSLESQMPPAKSAKRLAEAILEASRLVKEALGDGRVKEALRENPHLSLEEAGGRLYLVVPDAMTYAQASGRTSRMFAGGISKGLSVVVVDDPKAMEGLIQRSRWILGDVDWRPFEELNLKELLQEVDEDRRRVKAAMEGRLTGPLQEPVETALLLVESPTKARTIASFFGRPSKRRVGPLNLYETGTGGRILAVAATKGHLFDLVTRAGFHGVEKLNGNFVPRYASVKRCLKCGEQFTDLDACPVCGSTESADSLFILDALREAAKGFNVVYLGTDPDVEGEKISWDLQRSLSPYGLELKRVEFHEVTKQALLRALSEPRQVFEAYAEAQMARRIEDRWIGFELSQRLWSAFGLKRLSAGRVQTPVLGWIVERFKEYKESWRTFLDLILEGGFRASFEVQGKPKLPETCAVESAEVFEVELKPPPPYTTDAMIKEASSLLRLDAGRVMRAAQDLFELGLITYHRTDSCRVSPAGLKVAREYILEKFGSSMHVKRDWSVGEEGAHECIRPTRPLDPGKLKQLVELNFISPTKPLTKDHYDLYRLVFARFIASQMPQAKALKQKVTLRLGELKTALEGFVAVLEPGFTKAYPEALKLQPKVEKKELKVLEARVSRRPTKQLYTQGDVVALMKERGIGRPSTYAKIIETLIKRRYVVETKAGRLMPTRLGLSVYNYLSSRYSSLVSEERTRLLERKMDLIAEAKASFQEVIKELNAEIKGLP